MEHMCLFKKNTNAAKKNVKTIFQNPLYCQLIFTLLKANIVYCARESVRSAKYFMDLEIVTSCDLHTQIYYVIFDRYSCPFFKNKSRIGVLSSALGRHSSGSARPSEKRRNETSFSRSLGENTLRLELWLPLTPLCFCSKILNEILLALMT